MNGKELIIRICNDGVYFNWEFSIPIHNTNISKHHLNFQRHREFFCRVEMLKYNQDEKSLIVSVKQYYLTNITGFNLQKPKKIIEKLIFEDFDENTLVSLKNYDRSTESKKIDTLPPKQINNRKNNQTIEEKYFIGFNEIQFILGYVTFKKYIRRLDQEVEFKIANKYILAEFDTIKNWFAKILKIKKIRVIVTIVFNEEGVSKISAMSEDIDHITPEIIDCVKYERTYALSKITAILGNEKSLFTVDDIFEVEELKGNVFNQSESDILNVFLLKKDIRNKKQLDYLAGEMQSRNHKLHYTLKPNFGFLFVIEGMKHNHFVWELLNSHATYLWRIEKDRIETVLQIKKIESEVNNVRTFNRTKYKKSHKNNDQDNEIGFSIIYHEDINSNTADNFLKWRSKLNEQLT